MAIEDEYAGANMPSKIASTKPEKRQVVRVDDADI